MELSEILELGMLADILKYCQIHGCVQKSHEIPNQWNLFLNKMCSIKFSYKSSKHQLRLVLSSGARKIRNFALLCNRNLNEKFSAQPQLY